MNSGSSLDFVMAEMFTLVATEEELRDATSWVNTSFTWPQAQYDILCKSVGEAMFAWGQVEMRAYGIYLAALAAKSHEAAHASWEAQTGFRAKLAMADGCVRVSTAIKPDLDVWGKLKERCRKKSLRRNNIAHGVLFYEHTQSNLSRKFFIATPDAEGKIDKRDFVSDVIQMRNGFCQLADDLSDFHMASIA